LDGRTHEHLGDFVLSPMLCIALNRQTIIGLAADRHDLNWHRSAICGYPLFSPANTLTREAASRHTTVSISHTHWISFTHRVD